MMSEVSHPDIVVDRSQEVVVRSSAETTLFRTEDPQEIVARATEMATVLAKVLKEQKLTSMINGREHVRVEGWTFCGTMLGVFPVCVWTRPVQEGWEARVEARTRDGAVVGAAEAECLRSEKTWKTRDDYAIRSMAQTRATSKALRLPLGFIVSLAGFEATPAEEIPDESGTVTFNPETDLLPGAIKGAGAARSIFEALQALAQHVDWAATAKLLANAVYGAEDPKKIPAERKPDWLRRMSNATAKLAELAPASGFPPATDAQVMEAFAFAFSGHLVHVVAKSEPVDEAAAEHEALDAGAAEAAAAEVNAEQIPFGE